VVHIDSFGNLITNITAKHLENQQFIVKLGRFKARGLQQFYAAGSDLMGLIGSSGYLEIALKNGSAKDYMEANVGDNVQVEF
jgi:S-adenosylmethionine hydrolase